MWRSLELGLVDACDDDAIDEAAATEGDADDPAVTTRNRHSAWANMHDVRFKTTRVARVCPSLVSRLLLGAKADLCFENFEDEGTDAFGAFVDARGSGSKGKKKEKKKVNHLGLAVAAINALAAGEKRNATPFTWRLRPPPPDANGRSFPEGAPLEIVDFFSVAKCVPSGGVPPQRGFHNSGYGVRSKGLEV